MNMRRIISCKAFLTLVASVAAVADDHHQGGDAPSSSLDGRIVQSLFRFPATQLGPEFDELLQTWHSEWLHADADDTNVSSLPKITPESAGTTHAFYSVATPAATLFRRQCYGPAPVETKKKRNLYKNFEQKRKAISFQYIKDSAEEMKLIHTMTNRFYPAFMHIDDEEASNGGSSSARRMHKKKSKSTVDTIYAQTTIPTDYDSPGKLAFQTVTKEDLINNKNSETIQQWAWHPPAHFSSRGVPNNMQYRINMYQSMRNAFQSKIQEQIPNFEFEYGRQSGMFWYPPGGVREWHNNYLDLVGNMRQQKSGDAQTKEEEIFASQVWRMYFVRTVRDEKFDEKLTRLKKQDENMDGTKTNSGHSAMHIIPGNDTGITLEVLQKAGARQLTEDEKKRQWSDEFAEDFPTPSPSDENASRGADGELDRNSVWRVPDQDGYVTLFRLPDIWHCIVSEEVHRYSLGFAFSDEEVQALLTLAKVDFDVNTEDKKTGDVDIPVGKDEL